MALDTSEQQFRTVGHLLNSLNKRDLKALESWLRRQSTNAAQGTLTRRQLSGALSTYFKPQPNQNLLLKLAMTDQTGRCHLQLALSLITVMSSQSGAWDRFIRDTLTERCLSFRDVDHGNGILHAAAQNGRCHILEQFLDASNVSLVNRYLETPLHLAAMAGQEKDVEVLLRCGADVLACDRDECTPLHSAAQSAEPNPDVARLLIDAMSRMRQQTANGSECADGLCDSAGNTPLHVAAGNVNAGGEFLRVMFDMEHQHRKLNQERDTPFHVAAKSGNPRSVVVLLQTLQASVCGCSIEDLDIDRLPDDWSLMEICAVAGNAEAVQLLLQNGADISHRLLHALVNESVRDPSKTASLIKVYHAVVDNALHWRSVHEHEKFPVGDNNYFRRRMQTVMYLLTRKDDLDVKSKNVIEQAISVGAREMLEAIVDTENVFRFSDNPYKRHPHTSAADIEYGGTWHIVTNFVSSTESPRPVDGATQPADVEPTKNETSSEQKFDKIFKPRKPYLASIVLDNAAKWRNTDILLREPFRKLTVPFINFVQFIYLILAMVQLAYMIVFSVFCLPTASSLSEQLSVPNASHSGNYSSGDTSVEHGPGTQRFPAFWWLIWPGILFLGSGVHLFVACLRPLAKRYLSCQRAKVKDSDEPDAASPKPDAGEQTPSCDCDSTGVIPTIFFSGASSDSRPDCSGQETRSRMSSCSDGYDEPDGNCVSHRPSMYDSENAIARDSDMVPKATSVTQSHPTQDTKPAVLLFNRYSVFNLFPVVIFCVADFLWYFARRNSVTMTSVYIVANSMVFLFGWTTNFIFFSGTRKEFYLFSVVLRKFIIKDVCFKFMPLFFFTVLAFSFSVHVLQLLQSSAGQPQSTVEETIYDMLAAAIVMGELFEQTKEQTKQGGRAWFLQLVFTVYVYFTAVILLNVLIAMMNQRYEKTRTRTERVWRFRLVQIAMTIQNNVLYRRLVRPACCEKLRFCHFLRGMRQYDEDSQQFLLSVVSDKAELRHACSNSAAKQC